jgi:hypothetical protein
MPPQHHHHTVVTAAADTATTATATAVTTTIASATFAALPTRQATADVFDRAPEPTDRSSSRCPNYFCLTTHTETNYF